MSLMRFGSYTALALTLLLGMASCGRASSMDTVEVRHGLSPVSKKLAAEMEDLKGQHIHMPPLPYDYDPARYINTLPAELREQIKGKVVLLDIWDYTCVNCIRTLPYIQQWNDRYKDKGLVIIGVHSPEFEFEKDPKNLDSAVHRFGLTYPIIADNEYQIWNSLANQYWPAKYLFDKNGILRTEHFGEGEYQSFEAFLQTILLERDSTLSMPEPVAPVRETDKPGAVCYRATPETYIGFARSHIGNVEGDLPNKAHTYAAPADLHRDQLYLDGPWEVKREYAHPVGTGPASLVISYQAKEVNLVLHPLESTTGSSPLRLWVLQDDKPLPKADWGSDVREEGGRTFIQIDNPRMYNIVNNSQFSRYTLRLTSDSPQLGAYAFTFTSACQVH